jgi:hypothetical protein
MVSNSENKSASVDQPIEGVTPCLVFTVDTEANNTLLAHPLTELDDATNLKQPEKIIQDGKIAPANEAISILFQKLSSLSQGPTLTENEAKTIWDSGAKIIDLKQEIREWEKVATPTASDVKAQEDKLKEIRQELKALEDAETAFWQQQTTDLQAVSLLDTSAKGITKQQVIRAFTGLHFDANQWSAALADGNRAPWLLGCRKQKGTRSRKHLALWCPVEIALALTDKGRDIQLKKLDAVFVAHSFLKPWRERWTDISDRFRG